MENKEETKNEEIKNVLIQYTETWKELSETDKEVNDRIMKLLLLEEELLNK